MRVRALTLPLMFIVVFLAAPATAADALFRSGIESTVCAGFAMEPNDTLVTYDAIALDSSASAITCGQLSPADGYDYFRISIAQTGTVVVETILADGVTCEPSSPMSLTLYDPTFTQIATNSAGGTGGCASLDGLTAANLQNLGAGSYYIRVVQTTFDAAGPNPLAYALSVKVF